MKPIYLEVWQDGLTGGIQLSIGDDSGGFRVGGPKFSGTGKSLRKFPIDQYTATEIRRYLDQAFGKPGGA